MSNAAASACAAARVAGARPPSRSPAAIERMKMPRSAGSASIRARSPSSAPPERFDEGSTASTATLRPSLRQPATSALSSVDLPAPGGPVTPTMCAGASRPRAAGETAPSRAEISGRAAADRFSTRLSAAGAAGEVALGEAAAEAASAPPRAHAAAEVKPLRSATSATTSRRMRVSSKSFGV